MKSSAQGEVESDRSHPSPALPTRYRRDAAAHKGRDGQGGISVYRARICLMPTWRKVHRIRNWNISSFGCETAWEEEGLISRVKMGRDRKVRRSAETTQFIDGLSNCSHAAFRCIRAQRQESSWKLRWSRNTVRRVIAFSFFFLSFYFFPSGIWCFKYRVLIDLTCNQRSETQWSNLLIHHQIGPTSWRGLLKPVTLYTVNSRILCPPL